MNFWNGEGEPKEGDILGYINDIGYEDSIMEKVIFRYKHGIRCMVSPLDRPELCFLASLKDDGFSQLFVYEYPTDKQEFFNWWRNGLQTGGDVPEQVWKKIEEYRYSYVGLLAQMCTAVRKGDMDTADIIREQALQLPAIKEWFTSVGGKNGIDNQRDPYADLD